MRGEEPVWSLLNTMNISEIKVVDIKNNVFPSTLPNISPLEVKQIMKAAKNVLLVSYNQSSQLLMDFL